MTFTKIHKILLPALFAFSLQSARSQCNWAEIYYESYEYTTVVPYVIPGSIYHDSPQTTALANCVRTGTRGLYMNIVDNYSGLLYSQPFTDLCVGQNYRFTFSVRNATSAPNPNLTFRVLDGNNAQLATYTTTATTTWSDVTMTTFTANTSSITFEISTNLPGGNGNDAGFDDLRLWQCQPVPSNYSVNVCAGTPATDLYPQINNPVLSSAGTWTGPSALQNGYLGTFDETTNTPGSYTYTIGGAAGCADSVAIVAVQTGPAPVLDPVSNVSACGSYSLPAITGTNLNGTQKYYTGPNATGSVMPSGFSVTSTQTIYIHAGSGSCSDETSFTVTISTPLSAGSDNAANYCGPGASINLNTYLSGAAAGGTWAETTTPASGVFNPATGIFNSATVAPGSFTFSYTVPANGACPADQVLFTIGIGNFPPVHLGNDTTICQGQSLQLNATGPYNSYLWNNGSTAPIRTVNSTGVYSVKVGVLGSNQIVNGDFEQGNTGFSTDYIVGTGGTYGQLSNEGTYAITTSPNLVHNNFYVCQDHSAAPGTKMMVVNGAASPNVNVWCQTVPLQPNTDYQFGTWVTSMENTTNANLAQLQFSINGNPFGTVYTPSTQGCNWGQFTQNWNSGINTSAQICVVSQNFGNPGGNDFAIDDITFRPICFSYDTIAVTVAPAPIVNLGPNQNKCLGETVTLDAQNPGSTYAWTGGSTGQTLNVTNSGNYSVTVTSPQGCIASDNAVITFETPVSAGTDVQDQFCITGGNIDLNTLLSAGATATGQWFDLASTMNGALTSAGTLDYSQLTGNHQATYIVTGTYCPNDSATVDFVVHDQPDAGPDGNTHLCNTSGDLFDVNTLIAPVNEVLPGSWSETSVSPSSQFDPTTGTLDVSNLASGSYIFSYTLPAEQPCVSDIATVTVLITENPVVQFSANKLRGCLPLDVTFLNESITSANSTYFWDTGDGSVYGEQLTFDHTYYAPHCFDVTLTITADNLCTSTLTIDDMICADPNPVAEFHFSPQQLFSDGPLVQFENTSTHNDFNSWSFGDGETSVLPEPEHQYPLGEVGNYTVQLIVTTNAGCSDTAYQYIIVQDQLLFYVPNTFTPDGDEFNNIFIPVMTAGFDAADYTLKIYDRWGELVFQSNDIHTGWDGTYNGKLMKEGTYTWTLDFGHNDTDERFIRQGHVNLLR